MASEHVTFAVVVQADITDPVAVAATDVATIVNDEAGTVDPYIPPATQALKSAVMRAVGVAINEMPGAKFRSASILPFPLPGTTAQADGPQDLTS
jgi:hypothetical protein